MGCFRAGGGGRAWAGFKYTTPTSKSVCTLNMNKKLLQISIYFFTLRHLLIVIEDYFSLHRCMTIRNGNC